MNWKAYRIILGRQIRQKFGRFLLASGGIAVGVWAITLTNGLSSGVQETVITAINSQPLAKEVQVFKTTEESRAVIGQESPTFLPQPRNVWEGLAQQYPQIKSVITNESMETNVYFGDANPVCSIQQLGPVTLPGRPSSSQSQVEDERCANITISSSNVENLYENNRSNWIGKIPSELASNEIVLCSDCGVRLSGKLGIEKPEDLIGRTVVVKPTRAPTLYELDQEISFDRNGANIFLTSNQRLQSPLTRTFVVGAVINDNNAAAISFTGTSGSPAYLPTSVFDDAFDNANPGRNQNEYGLLGARLVVNQFNDLEQLNTELSKQYFTFSLGLSLVEGVTAAFLVLNSILILFGLIAIVASVFGIVNVMAISVLERKKEIGILKALGSKNSSIFFLFLSESAVLGVLGWLIGNLFAVGMGYGIAALAQYSINSNAELQSNLATFNITGFSPVFSPWLFVITLVIALFFTIISGLLPSLRAARQNPAEVMRAE